MPMKWVEPEVFVSIYGVNVYHCYKEGDINHRLHYIYTTDRTETKKAYVFDVRDVAAKLHMELRAPQSGLFRAQACVVMLAAMDAGLISIPEED